MWILTTSVTGSPPLVYCTPAIQGSSLSLAEKPPATGPLHFLFPLPMRLLPITEVWLFLHFIHAERPLSDHLSFIFT